jgi:hypothetical protein
MPDASTTNFLLYFPVNSYRWFLHRGEAGIVVFAINAHLPERAGGSYGVWFGYSSLLYWLDKDFEHDCIH